MSRRPIQVVQSLLCCVLLTACTAGTYTPQGKGSSTVVLVVTTGTNAMAAPAIAKATPVVVTLRFTISASDMTTIQQEVAFTPPGTIEESFDVPNGTGRVFLVEAVDSSGIVVYAGSSTSDLAGNDNNQPVEVSIMMVQQFLSGEQVISTSWRDRGTAMARDSGGNLIAVGMTWGNLDGSPNADVFHRSPDVFVTKFSITGSKIWSRQFGSSQGEVVSGVAIDASGNIYVTGSTTGNLNSQTNADTTLTSADAFLVKLDASGSVLWTKLLGSTASDVANSIAIDSTGNVFITGETYGSLGTFTNAGSADIFVAEYDKDGNLLALDQQGTPYKDTAEGIAIDTSDNMYVAASTYGDLGSTNMAGSAGVSPDVCLIRYISGGQTFRFVSMTQFGTPLSDVAAAIAVDNAGNAYITGSTWGGFDGNTNSDPSGITPDVFIAKLNVDGLQVPTAQLGSRAFDTSQGIAYDPSGYLYVTGITTGSLDGNASAGDGDIFLAKYDTSGNKIWTRQIGTVYNDEGNGVVADNYGNAFIIGASWVTSSLDAVVMSFNKNGDQW